VGYSLAHLSVGAVRIARGFVVEDAIVVLKIAPRHIEAGMPRLQAALLGASEVGFTVLSMSISLIAVFIPILLMGGIVGRLFREFAVVLSTAVMVSLVISLSTTPMMCAYVLRRDHGQGSIFFRIGERIFGQMARGYERSLNWALGHPWIIGASLMLTIAVNVYLYGVTPKGFFPQQDTGRLVGTMRVDQSASFASIRDKFTKLLKSIKEDP